ncbi:MAG: hypothetical protein FD167_5061 [bacterium]|nr:MAG: hypothetical protein FD167_5061 [bacterium]
MRKKATWWSFFALICGFLLTQIPTTFVLAEGGCNAPELICKAARNQDISLTFRDRCSYEQRAHIELYKKEKDGSSGKLEKLRETTVKVEPSPTPDETGKLLVNNRVVADTDDKGKPKGKVDPNARTGLASGAFLDLLFFPLLPEKISNLEFEELPNTNERYKGEKLFRFGPKPGASNLTLASGKVYVNAQTGAVLTVQIEGLHNLKTFDKVLEKLERVVATIDYSEFDSKYRMPTLATGGGISDVTRFKGIFKFTFEEGKYVQVLKLQ